MQVFGDFRADHGLSCLLRYDGFLAHSGLLPGRNDEGGTASGRLSGDVRFVLRAASAPRHVPTSTIFERTRYWQQVDVEFVNNA